MDLIAFTSAGTPIYTQSGGRGARDAGITRRAINCWARQPLDPSTGVHIAVGLEDGKSDRLDN